MKFRVSDGHSAAVEFEASTEALFVDRCSTAIREFWAAQIPYYQTRKMGNAIQHSQLQLHTKTVLDRFPRQWTWVARDGHFVHVTISRVFRDVSAIWATAIATQRHAAALAKFLGDMNGFLRNELTPPPFLRPSLKLVTPSAQPANPPGRAEAVPDEAAESRFNELCELYE